MDQATLMLLRQKKLFGTVGIDMIAGPSEILIIADKKNNPEHIAIDLLSQAEHDELAQSILITDDIEFAEKVSNNINKYLKYIKRKKLLKKAGISMGLLSSAKILTMQSTFLIRLLQSILKWQLKTLINI